MGVVNLGLDFGSTGLRAAYTQPGGVVRMASLADSGWPWVFCERQRTGTAHVSFPSLKNRLGLAGAIRVDGRGLDPQDIVSRILDSARRCVEAEASATVSQAVISVPMSYQSAQRTALRDAAAAAGLADVQLINDSMAAVIGHADRRAAGTFLVCALGYRGFEAGLIRVVRDHYRALSYAHRQFAGGGTFDEELVNSWVHTLRQYKGSAIDRSWEDTVWEQLRIDAQLLRERLRTGWAALYPTFFPDRRAALAVLIEPESGEQLKREVTAIFDRVDTVFAQAGLGPADVDAVLLVGGCTRMEPVQTRAAALGRVVVATSPGHLARGAALYADRLNEMPLTAQDDSFVPSDDDATVTQSRPVRTTTVLAALSANQATGTRAPAGKTSAAMAAEEPQRVGADGGQALSRDIEAARRLLDQGQIDEAMTVLRGVISAAQPLLEEVPPPGRKSGPGSDVAAAPADAPPSADAPAAGLAPASERSADAAKILLKAKTLQADGRYEEAVSMSHGAWDAAPDEPDVFEAMIDTHCVAAMASTGPEGFPVAERWLRCAVAHDPSNARIRGLLATRTYDQASDLSNAGQHAEAIRTVEHALRLDPDHRASRELLRRLTRRRSSPR